MEKENLRKEFGNEYSENVKSEIPVYNPDYVLWLEMKLCRKDLDLVIIKSILENNNKAKDGLKTVRLILESLSDLDLGKLLNEFNSIIK